MQGRSVTLGSLGDTMTAPLPARIEGYELYRVITDYEALQDGFQDRIDDLETTLAQIEMNGGLAQGNAHKLLTKNPGKRIERKRDHRHASAKRTFGWESLGKMLKGTGLALVLVVDDERFAPLKEQLTKRKRPRQPPNGSIRRPPWLISKKSSQNMQVLRNAKLSPRQRKMIAKAAARARWRKPASAAPCATASKAQLRAPVLAKCRVPNVS